MSDFNLKSKLSHFSSSTTVNSANITLTFHKKTTSLNNVEASVERRGSIFGMNCMGILARQRDWVNNCVYDDQAVKTVACG